MDLEWIRRGLKKPGKTQAGLGRAIGRSESVASRIVDGSRPLKVHEVPKIAAYLGEAAPNGHAHKALATGGLPTPDEITAARKVQEILSTLGGVPADDQSLAYSLAIVRAVRSEG